MSIKLKWRVDPAPTGRYRSFQKRYWPSAEYTNQRPAFSIVCEDEYRPQNVKTGEHKPLTVRVAVYNERSFDWRTLKTRADTLADAKALAQRAIDQHPEWLPIELRNI